MSLIEQGDSPDGGSKPSPSPAVPEVKRKRKTKTAAKVIEVKTDEPMGTSGSPKTASAGLLPYPHNRGKVMYITVC